MVLSTLVSRLGRIVSNPLVAGGLLAVLLYKPSPLLTRYASAVRVAKTALVVLFSIGTTHRINTALTKLALNHWRLSAPKGWKWDEELAVVTGGSSGIGKAIVEGLTRKGVKVAILDVNKLPHDLESNPAVTFVQCDITSPDAVRDAAATVQASLGHPSILINNAGITGSPDLIIDEDLESVRRVMEVNALSHWFTVKAFVPEMVRRNKGHVVTVASMASFGCRPATTDYSGSKAAVMMFHEGLETELRYRHKTNGVMATLVHPSWVRTGMTERNAERIERVWGRMMKPETIADRVLENIFGRRGGQLIIPDSPTNRFFSTLRAWPLWVQTLIRDAYIT